MFKKSSEKLNSAFVFNCDYNGLAIIQELGSKGVPVYALDSKRSVGKFSKYATFKKCPNPAIDEEAFIGFIENLARQFIIPPILFPTNDQWATAISKHKKRLKSLAIPCVVDWSTMEVLIHKEQFYKWGMSRGYPVPKTWELNSINKIEQFPIIAKPKYRRICSTNKNTETLLKEMDKHRLVVLNSKKELEAFLHEKRCLIPHFVFQEYVRGMTDCMYTVGIYADDKSNVKAVFTGRKVRGSPPDIGDCVVGESYKTPSYLIKITKKIVKDLHYSGIAEFEFKKDSQTGEFKLIEINPRSWSWIGITPYCGVSIPWIAYTDLTGIKKYREPIISKTTSGSVKYIKILEDFKNCLYKYKGYPEWAMTFGSWWKSLSAQKRVYAEFSRWDWKVTVYALYCFAKNITASFLNDFRRKVGF